ncbi:unnamed protein product [Ostreobium quekettii]|uniref:Photosystem II 10 kDa polypeptide, chloroplastic n=1 Tax=Ostreobium quekettii TaxID=121088 RepID=A0A8S1JC19_9CHLO|nr:unnamed protein product [Ostreobium quekettii]|eukprot:evm.model.scf_811.3 EVM.evm.TU.scf_811.3   scf_811:19144-21398(+)
MAPAVAARKALAGAPLGLGSDLGRRRPVVDSTVYANARSKNIVINPQKQGVNSVKNKVVRENLLGQSKTMERKGWLDPQGRKGKGLGVYRFAKKYGTNVDGYSPIYTPDIWSKTGESYDMGQNGLIIWGLLLALGFFVAIRLVVATSAL